jgi:hypothetical protein
MWITNLIADSTAAASNTTMLTVYAHRTCESAQPHVCVLVRHAMMAAGQFVSAGSA